MMTEVERNTSNLIGCQNPDDIAPLFTLIGMVARAQGPVTQGQIQEVQRFMQQLSPKERERAKDYFRRGKEERVASRVITEHAFKLYLEPDRRWLTSLEVVRILLRVALVDGDYGWREEYIIENTRQTLGLHARAYWSLRDTLAERYGVRNVSREFANAEPLPAEPHDRAATREAGDARPDVSNSGLSRVAALQILGLKANATVQEIRVAYRSLVKRFHPDLLASAKVSDQELKSAMTRFCEVQEAYEMLQQAP